MQSLPRRLPATDRGFTLIEMCAVVLVISVLALLAMSSYSQQIQKSRRVEAKNALLDLAAREQQLYSSINAYSTTPTDVGYTGASFPITVGSGYYQVSIAVTAATATAPATFTLTAVPIGSQAADTTCSKFTTNQLGAQSATDGGGADTSATCW